ncbi:hypothetical protein DXG03_002254 [Asterophora parasitica]|uniref:Uncharacterized protein n=1 Tax=Asterophora parasitica TaxID=117018 RepID=A0A9P7G4M6_9AGAR|nr:hypothetical protein DXG03_002254 [Asterophora parasitica]
MTAPCIHVYPDAKTDSSLDSANQIHHNNALMRCALAQAMSATRDPLNVRFALTLYNDVLSPKDPVAPHVRDTSDFWQVARRGRADCYIQLNMKTEAMAELNCLDAAAQVDPHFDFESPEQAEPKTAAFVHYANAKQAAKAGDANTALAEYNKLLSPEDPADHYVRTHSEFRTVVRRDRVECYTKLNMRAEAMAEFNDLKAAAQLDPHFDSFDYFPARSGL